jgi:hypothetical protein
LYDARLASVAGSASVLKDIALMDVVVALRIANLIKNSHSNQMVRWQEKMSSQTDL